MVPPVGRCVHLDDRPRRGVPRPPAVLRPRTPRRWAQGLTPPPGERNDRSAPSPMWRGWPGSRSPRSPAPFGVSTGSPPRPVSACCASRRTCTTSPPPRRRRSRQGAPASSRSSHPSSPAGSSRPSSAPSRRACGPAGTTSSSSTSRTTATTSASPSRRTCCGSGSTASSRSTSRWRDEEVELVDRLGLPLVAIGSPVPGRACVRIDDRAAMRTAVEHLVGLGHTRIGYIGAVPAERRPHPDPPGPARGLPRGGRRAGPDVRRRLDPRLGLDGRGGRPRQRRAALARPNRPTAIVAASDEMAIGVRESARRLGLRVPEDLSIIGIDDFVLSGVLGLTTVRQDVAGRGTPPPSCCCGRCSTATSRPRDRHADRARACASRPARCRRPHRHPPDRSRGLRGGRSRQFAGRPRWGAPPGRAGRSSCRRKPGWRPR